MILEIEGIPTPQTRPRVSKAGHFYSDASPKLKEWKKAIKVQAKEQCEAIIPKGTFIQIGFYFLFPRPQKAAHKFPSRCDLDNLIKAVKDALTGIVWEDDRWVVDYLFAQKRYCPNGSKPGVILNITPVD